MAEERITDEERRAAALMTSGSRREVESTLKFLRDESMAQPRPMQQTAIRPQPVQLAQYPRLPQIKAAVKKKKTWTLLGIAITSIVILALGILLFYLLFA